MFGATVDFDMSGMEARIRAMSGEMNSKSIVRALNKVADQSKVAASREIRSAGYNIKAADIKRQIKVIRATGSNRMALVRASGRPIPLIAWSARQTKKGVSVKVVGKRKIIRGAFIARMPGGHLGVFVKKPGGKHVKSSRQRGIREGDAISARFAGNDKVRTYLPIEERYGPSLPRVFANEVIMRELKVMVEAKFPSLLKHEALNMLRGRRA